MTGAQFISSLEYDPNSTSVTKTLDADQKKLDIGFNLARLGDGQNRRFIMYCTEGRVLHLKQAAPAIAVEL